MKTAAVLALLFQPLTAWADLTGWWVAPDAGTAQSKIYRSQTSGLHAGYRRDGYAAALGAHNLIRTFDDDTRFNETAYDFSGAAPLGSRAYIEADLSVSPDAILLPRTVGSLNPHWVSGSNDFSVGIGGNVYANSRAGFIHPLWIRSLREDLTVGLGTFQVRTDSWISSFHGDVDWKITPRHRARVDLAGGRTLEDAGLEATFNSLTAGYSYNLEHWSLGVSGTQYWSTTRPELSSFLRLEYRP